MKRTLPMPWAPLAWWEYIQLDILAGLGMTEEAAHFREHPDQWRAFREKIRERADRRGKSCSK